ncbi:MAG: ArnT family glycosyltransferase [Candidatus Helarchaeota archaeon]
MKKLNLFLKKLINQYLSFFVYLLLLIVFMGSSLYKTQSFGESEGTFIALGFEISQGSVMYKDLFDHHTPLFYYLLAIVFVLFGTNLFVYRFLNILMMSLVALFVEKIIRLKYKRIFGFFGGIGTILFFQHPNYQANRLTLNLPTILFMIIGNYFILKTSYQCKEKYKFYYLSFGGFFISLSFLTKHIIAFLFLSPLFAISFWYLDNHTTKEIKNFINSKKEFLTRLIIFSITFLIPLIIWILYLLYTHSFKAMLYQLIIFNKQIPRTSLLSFIRQRTIELSYDIHASSILYFLPIFCIIYCFIKPELKKDIMIISNHLWLVGLIIFLYLAPGYFGHYLIMIIPSMGIYFGIATHIIDQTIPKTNLNFIKLDKLQSYYRKTKLKNYNTALFVFIISILAGQYSLSATIGATLNAITSDEKSDYYLAIDYLKNLNLKDYELFAFQHSPIFYAELGIKSPTPFLYFSAAVLSSLTDKNLSQIHEVLSTSVKYVVIYPYEYFPYEELQGLEEKNFVNKLIITQYILENFKPEIIFGNIGIYKSIILS